METFPKKTLTVFTFSLIRVCVCVMKLRETGQSLSFLGGWSGGVGGSVEAEPIHPDLDSGGGEEPG